MVLPLGVEPDKPRLIWDAPWLNLMCTHMPFTMDFIGKVAQWPWPRAHQVTLNHKSGFHYVGLNAESWTLFALCWQGVYYLFTVRVSDGVRRRIFPILRLRSAAGQCLRALDIPLLVWLDDSCWSNS